MVTEKKLWDKGKYDYLCLCKVIPYTERFVFNC